MADPTVLQSGKITRPPIGMEPTCEIVTDFRRLEELSPNWEKMWRANPSGEIFQSFAWARAWWQCYGNTLQLCTPIIHERGEPVFILPLVQRGKNLSFLGMPQSDYCDFICATPQPENWLALAFETLLNSGLVWKECVMQNLPPGSRLMQSWTLLPSHLKKLLQVRPTESCPTIVLGDKRGEILETLTGKKHTRRRLNKLNKAGQVIFRHIEDRVEAQEQLTQFFQSHLERCALLGKTSSFEDPAMCEFLRALITQLDLKNELRFSVVELNTAPIAWSIGFLLNGKFSFYQQTFAVKAEEYAPGEVLMYYLLEYAKNNVEREFDFMRGEEFFKRRFATDVRQSFTLYLERRGISGQVRRRWRSAQARSYDSLARLEVALRAHPLFPKLRSVLVWYRKRKPKAPPVGSSHE